LLNIITERTIVIGHSVYNDLKALHLNHVKCVDTAYLFPVDNESESSRPGLKLVAEQLLGINLPEPHDSVWDSRIALYAAAYALEVGFLSIKRTATAEQPSLMVHRIPEYVTEEHIKTMMTNHTYIMPTSITTMIRGESQSPTDPVGKVTVYFLTPAHAELAFDSISGPIKPDKKNRPQKKVYLQGGGHVYVRK
jgi:RNA exonuclease 1